MNIASAKNQIKDTVEAYLERDDAGMYVIPPVHQRPIFLVGAPGIGKTAIMEQIAHELGIGIMSYSMSHHTRQSALGLPRIEHKEFEGMEYDASVYTMSEIVGAVYDYVKQSGMRRGILFLDEINCVSETLHPSMLQFLQYKTFGKHKVPDDWIVVCAGNPPEYNRSVHEFDIVTLDRLRQIDVEPDYAVWKNYASAKGIHPAVTTFLDAKRNCFYKVESKAGGGKVFVTARGWEDMASIISLYEKMGKPVDRDLIVQFLRDEDIADQFSVYYSLFQKYRADYQVGRILEGNPADEVYSRARNADFDERVALIGLLHDALATECDKALDQENIVLSSRDIIREIKPELMEGASIETTLIARLAERESALARVVEANTMSPTGVRKERLVIKLLRKLVNECTMARTTEGPAAFETLATLYKAEVDKIQPLVDDADGKMSNAFQFVADCFESREMLVFLAEVTTRQATTQFISHYGNEAFYKFNDQLQVDVSRANLEDRISKLQELADDTPFAATHTVSDGGTVGLGASAGNAYAASVPTPKSDAEKAAEAAAAAKAEAEAKAAEAARLAAEAKAAEEAAKAAAEAKASEEAQRAAAALLVNGVENAEELVEEVASPVVEEAPQAVPARKEGEKVTPQVLDQFYNGREFEWGFASMSKMTINNVALKGKKVLDVQCRRGKGVFKFSSKVGAAGTAIGVDSSQVYIEDAMGDEAKAFRRNGLKKSNMEFKVAYPEDLMVGGIGDSSVDVVYINNVMTLLYDQQLALKEFFRVLRPGGILIVETIFSDKERDEAVVAKAREIGNSVQAGRTEGEFFQMLATAGFGEPEVIDSYEVRAERGFIASQNVETIESDEEVAFSAVAINAVKPA